MVEWTIWEENDAFYREERWFCMGEAYFVGEEDDFCRDERDF